MEFKLSNKQKYALKIFNKGENIFLTGSAGTGKSFLIHKMIESAKDRGREIQVCAMTGIASVLLNCKAKTVHSWSGIRLCTGENSDIISRVIKNNKYVVKWREVDILVIDEVSMMSEKVFTVLEEIARLIRGIQKPFGGIQVVFTGDMFQLPPIGDGQYFCFECRKWFELFQPKNHIELTDIFRQTDSKYINILNHVRLGNLDEDAYEELKKRVGLKTEQIAITRLFPTRLNVERLNQYEFNKIDEPIFRWELKTKTNETKWVENGVDFDEKVQNELMHVSHQEIEYELETMKTNMSQCPAVLELKKGAVVMCIANIDLDLGICNGSQGKVVDIHLITSNVNVDMNVPLVKFNNGIEMYIKPKSWQNENLPCITIKQIPLVLAWATTIHKSQGLTLSHAEMDLGNQVFEYGQAYVALSRVKSLEGLYLTALNPNKIKAHPRVIEFYTRIIKPYQVEPDDEVVQQPQMAIATAVSCEEMGSELLPIADVVIQDDANNETRKISTKSKQITTFSRYDYK
jgi:ATP-dependent DNA helicase PIF1